MDSHTESVHADTMFAVFSRLRSFAVCNQILFSHHILFRMSCSIVVQVGIVIFLLHSRPTWQDYDASAPDCGQTVGTDLPGGQPAEHEETSAQYLFSPYTCS